MLQATKSDLRNVAATSQSEAPTSIGLSTDAPSTEASSTKVTAADIVRLVRGIDPLAIRDLPAGAGIPYKVAAVGSAEPKTPTLAELDKYVRRGRILRAEAVSGALDGVLSWAASGIKRALRPAERG